VSRYCLDTSAYSRFQRGNQDVTDILDRAEWIGVPAIVLGELRTGFLLGSHRERNERELEAFLGHPVTQEVEIDGEVSRQYAQIVVELRKAGTPVPTNDIWIAATAARTGALVLSFDRHFEQILRVGSVILGKD
jgi:tRNA(fMet)-specific endonuclease VapC